MGRNSSGVRGGKGRKTSSAKADWELFDEKDVINEVKKSLMTYPSENRWNNSNDDRMGFIDITQHTVNQLADGNYGFASDVAKTVQKYRYKASEKQAYVMAKAAVENKISSLTKSGGNKLESIYRPLTKEEKREMTIRTEHQKSMQRERRRRARERRKERERNNQ